MVVCRSCGSDRLIPLSFPAPWRKDVPLGQPEPELLPVIKCVRGGERSYARIEVHQAIPED